MKREFAVADNHGNVCVNIADKNTMMSSMQRPGRLGTLGRSVPCEEPTGLAIDRKRDKAFASYGNRKLAVVSLGTGKVVQTLPIGDDCDATAFDLGANLVFASKGEC